MMNKPITISELADILGVQYQTVWRKAKTKDIQLIKSDDDQLRIRSDDVFKLVCLLRYSPLAVKKERFSEIVGQSLQSGSDKT